MTDTTNLPYSPEDNRTGTWPPAGPQAALSEKLLLDEREAAALLGIGARTLAEARYAGHVPFVRLAGRRVLYDRRDLLGWIDRAKEQARPREISGGGGEKN